MTQSIEIEKSGSIKQPWDILIVDDDADVHQLTTLALSRFSIDGRGLRFHSAFSGAEARRLLADNSQVAVVLLDVVMETTNAGLELVRHIRENQNNRNIRIVLRTGQPGAAPERSVVDRFDINDYKEKSELTAGKLYTTIRCALRAYSDLQELEHQKLAAEWAIKDRERAEKSKSDFLANINHELRTPLNAILGYSEVLHMETFGPIGNPKYLEYASAIHKSGSHLLSSINRIIALTDARRSDTSTETEDTEFDLWVLISESVQASLPKSYQSTSAPRLPVAKARLMVNAPRKLLGDAISEIVSNAVRHAGANAKISAGILRQPNGSVFIVVRDTGHGFPDNIIENLGKPFNISGDIKTATGRGMGVGLALAAMIADRIDGHLTARNLQGQGAEVTIALPSARVITSPQSP